LNTRIRKYKDDYKLKVMGLASSVDKLRSLAIVFPQYHAIPENDKLWGVNFTEWTMLKPLPRVARTEIIKKPHADLGYYNLLDYEHRRFMRILADRFGLYGFMYYHYWFKDFPVMYKPMELMLKDGEPNKPFCFCWANEQWTRGFDGSTNGVLLAQDYSDIEGNIKHFEFLLPYFRHKNYIRIKKRPVFLFYRIEPEDAKTIRELMQLWQKLARNEGIPEIYFMKFLGPFNNEIQLEEIDGYATFEPG
jgi:lipopolysaccharide biosynthesis protein